MIKQTQLCNGTFTLENGTHHLTFKIATDLSKNGILKGQRIVSLMTGTDNESDYTGFGVLSDDSQFFYPWKETIYSSGRRRIWKKNPATGEFLTVRQLTACLYLIKDYGNFGEVGKDAKAKVEFEHNGKNYILWISTRCMRCNRALTNPESVAAGIGPECSNKG